MQSSHSSAGYSHSGFALVPRAPIRQTKTPSSNSPNKNTVIQFAKQNAVIQFAKPKHRHPIRKQKSCHPERSLARTLRQTQSKDLRFRPQTLEGNSNSEKSINLRTKKRGRSARSA